MKLMSHIIGSGAKGKFSGGFDISAFGGIQGGQRGMQVFFHAFYNLVMHSFIVNEVHFIYCS